MLLYYHSWMFYNHFIATLYHFFGTNLLTQCPVPVAVFACFLHRTKSISNGAQTPQNFLWIFYGLEDHQWARAAPGGVGRAPLPRNHPGHRFALILLLENHKYSKKISIRFYPVWTPFDIGFPRNKKHATERN